MRFYIGELERFGYTITVACKSEQECIDKLLKEYLRVYREQNDDDPVTEIAYDRYSDKTYYETAKEDIIVTEYIMGQVEWR